VFGTKIRFNPGPGFTSDRWPCPTCDASGLMPDWQREQSKPPLPPGTLCTDCAGHGVVGGQELED
jgi:hypothetical protein